MKIGHPQIGGIFAAVTGVLALTASCASPEDFDRQVAARCAEWGYQLGTPDYANCVQTNHARGHRACQNCAPGAQW